MKRSVKTPLGNLTFVGHCSDIELKAELRGMELLEQIVCDSNVWEFDWAAANPFLVSTDPGPQIVIDVFGCVISKLVSNDTHMTVYMASRRICVLKKPDAVNTPITDSIVSLALLGIAGWPIVSTPETMTEKSLAVDESGIYLEMKTSLEAEDLREMKHIHTLIEDSQHRNALTLTGKLSRRWYVCKGWSIEVIQQFLETLLCDIETRTIEAYLQQPSEPSDVMFLSASRTASHECSSAVATDGHLVSV